MKRNKTIRQTLKNNKIIYNTWLVLCRFKNSLKNKFLDYEAIKNFKKEKELHHKLVDGKINVGFVFTQEASDWGKIEPIFLSLLYDARFKVTIICFPPWLGDERIIVDNKNKNTNYEFIENKFADTDVVIIDGWLGNGKAVDLKSFDFSYVFYNSPYPHCSPKSYHPRIVSKYTKVCYTPYGFTLSKIFLPISSSWDFFRWVYCCYCVSVGEKKYFDERLEKAGTKTLQRNAFCGFPRIYQFVEQKNIETSMWCFSKNDFRVIWTPRWSTEDSIGGSNFLKYKDFMLELIKDNLDIDFVIRPHPLTFGNFIKTGHMTREEVDDYKKACSSGNSCLDETPEYATTFWKSSVLVTDFSSIIIEYFITENPIVFCTTKTNMDLPTEEFKKILSCCYIANNENEIKAFIAQLHNGDDPLKEKRLMIIKEIFGDDIKHIPERIAEDLCQDYMKTTENGDDK